MERAEGRPVCVSRLVLECGAGSRARTEPSAHCRAPRVPRAAPPQRPGGGSSWPSPGFAAALHPDDLVEMSARVWQVTEPLPLSYFLGMAYNAVDAAFVETAIEGRPDGDTAAWLAWLPADLRRAEECRALLGFGLPRTNVVTLMEAGIPPGQVASTADETGAPRDLVARALALWAPAGCRPKASDLRLLAEHGIPTYRPSAAAIDDLERHTADLPDAPTRTELGVMLAVGGTREAVVMGLAGGARSAVELVDKLEEQS